jgi:hypothetical protein
MHPSISWIPLDVFNMNDALQLIAAFCSIVNTALLFGLMCILSRIKRNG